MEQLELVKRYFIRLSRIDSGRNNTNWEDRKFHQDDFYSFFVHCHHIKDWILKLNIIGITPKEVNAFINMHKSLKLCADIANRKKHCKLNKSWTGFDPFISGTQHHSVNNSPHGIQSKFYVLIDDNLIDAFELAKDCVELWTKFIDDKNNNFNLESIGSE